MGKLVEDHLVGSLVANWEAQLEGSLVVDLVAIQVVQQVVD